MFLVIVLTFTALLLLLLFNNVNDDALKQLYLTIILISIFMFFRAKQDIRGNKISEIINKQAYWRKKILMMMS